MCFKIEFLYFCQNKILSFCCCDYQNLSVKFSRSDAQFYCWWWSILIITFLKIYFFIIAFYMRSGTVHERLLFEPVSMIVLPPRRHTLLSVVPSSLLFSFPALSLQLPFWWSYVFWCGVVMKPFLLCILLNPERVCTLCRILRINVVRLYQGIRVEFLVVQVQLLSSDYD